VDLVSQKQTHSSDAKYDEARLQIEILATSLYRYRLDVGSYPKTVEGLDALVHLLPNTPGWKGPYFKKEQIPADPWGHKYHYEFPGTHESEYNLYSLGADNAEGGNRENRDIVSWE
jgi:general secretion pathway protein G